MKPSNTVRRVLEAVGMALGVGVVVLGALKAGCVETNITLLGLAVLRRE